MVSRLTGLEEGGIVVNRQGRRSGMSNIFNGIDEEALAKLQQQHILNSVNSEEEGNHSAINDLDMDIVTSQRYKTRRNAVVVLDNAFINQNCEINLRRNNFIQRNSNT